MTCINPRRRRLLISFCLAALAATASQAQDTAQRLRSIPLQAGMHVIEAELALTPEQRQIGLMHRREMPANHGMLFVFESPQVQCFWMKNTLLPLSIAFIGDDGAVVNIADMKPLDETSTCSKKPVRYVLEMNQGWFAKKGIKAGFKLSGAPWQR